MGDRGRGERRARFHRSAALALTLAAAPACVHFDNLEEPIELATHAGDWRDQVIYQILVDRFADADYGNNYGYAPDHMARYHGGDWAGIEQNLDYLQELGVTALWISPVIKNVDTDAGVDGYIIGHLGGAPDHPMTIAFPEGEYLKGLVVVRK